MVLVDYPDSDSEVSSLDSQSMPEDRRGLANIENEQPTSLRKRKYGTFKETSQMQKPSPPPLPSTFYSLYATNVRTSTSDDPSLHGGRRRQVPHVEGNWPTHVYLEWYPSRVESEILEHTICTVRANTTVETCTSPKTKIHSLLQSDLGVHLPLHISLSMPLMLRTEQRASFLEKLENAVGSSDVTPFQLHVAGLDWVPNSEKTRWFLVLKLQRPENDGLNFLLAATNSVVRHSGLEMLYTDQDAEEDGVLEKECVDRLPAGKGGLKDRKQRRQGARVPADCTGKFHFSLAWQLEEPSKASIESADALESVKRLSISCDLVKIKIGNTIHDIPLPDGTLTPHCLGNMWSERQDS